MEYMHSTEIDNATRRVSARRADNSVKTRYKPWNALPLNWARPTFGRKNDCFRHESFVN